MRKDQKRLIATLSGIVLLTIFSVWAVFFRHTPVTLGPISRDFQFRLGLDLRGGTHLVYEADTKDLPATQVDDAMIGVRDVIERRVNLFGISEPVVQTSNVGNTHRIIVDLAGVYDPQEAIQLIGQTPQLDFRSEINPEDAKALLEKAGQDPNATQGPLFERTELSGKHLKNATVGFQSINGAPQVQLEFNDEGTKLFAELTKKNLNKRIAIYLDGVPISAPVVQNEITNGKAVISGGFTLDEAKLLAQNLKAGALPIPIHLVSQQTIGPTLGRLSVQQSIVAAVVGMILVVVWMVSFYRLPGLLASLALTLYTIFSLMLIKLIPITLTLAGLAGFVMSIGMAVDANVLVFERFRENLRAKKSVGYSLTDGFKGAWSAIRDSNISSLITAIILYAFGTSLIRGFALTLSLGIIVSMFTAITVTQTFMTIALAWPRLHKPALLAVKKADTSLV